MAEIAGSIAGNAPTHGAVRGTSVPESLTGPIPTVFRAADPLHLRLRDPRHASRNGVLDGPLGPREQFTIEESVRMRKESGSELGLERTPRANAIAVLICLVSSIALR